MDIKYTIEILTKDIQDIEKLVGKLQNSKDASSMELDLAMSKLRNVYEILTIIKADRLSELVGTSLNGFQEPEYDALNEPEPMPEPEPVAEPDPVPKPEPKAQKETLNEAEAESKTDPEPRRTEKEKPVAKESKSDAEESKSDAEESKSGAEESKSGAEESKSGALDPAILAEKFKAESSINENLAETRSEPMDTKLLGSAIDNIGRNIGINDRFLIIRELFAGNSEAFLELVSKLDSADSYENAIQILTSHFATSMEHEGVEILSGLVKRRYLSQ